MCGEEMTVQVGWLDPGYPVPSQLRSGSLTLQHKLPRWKQVAGTQRFTEQTVSMLAAHSDFCWVLQRQPSCKAEVQEGEGLGHCGHYFHQE
jgi:hypothetical protein